ncbi:MAG: glutaredoxin family protein [Longimicrobiales bacterium]
MDRQVRVYGADTCKETEHTREYLQELGVPHVYLNVEEDSLAEDRVRSWNYGKRRTPTLLVSSPVGSETLSVPSDAELDSALIRHGLLPTSRERASRP